jgi:AcrR family transcriptional regulator
VRLVTERGFSALSFQNLAEDLGVTRTAPLYYFGTTTGLVAAVASHGFDELSARLRRVQESGESSKHPLKSLGIAYGEYALRNPNVYRAMHAPELWQAVAFLDALRIDATTPPAKRAIDWIQDASGARQVAVMQFEDAVKHAETAGRVKKEPRSEKGSSTLLLTSIVDGFLFHYFVEHVGAGREIARLLTSLDVLLDRALTGLYLRAQGDRARRQPALQDKR